MLIFGYDVYNNQKYVFEWILMEQRNICEKLIFIKKHLKGLLGYIGPF